jgi:putative spermidine/putrescine transport system permease protein
VFGHSAIKALPKEKRVNCRARVFFLVVLPLALPGVLSAALFAFLASFDEIVISLFLAGGRAQTLPVRIWNSLHLEIEPVVAAAAAFLIVVTGAILLADAGLRRIRSSRPAKKSLARSLLE